jgi:hypothetical protein
MKKLIVISYKFYQPEETLGTNTFTFDSNDRYDGSAVNEALQELNKKYPIGMYVENIWIF